MRIVCPSCAAAYDVPDARVIPGQPVGCARCGTNWKPVAAAQPAPKPFGPLLPPIDAGSPSASNPTPSPSETLLFPPSGSYAQTFDRPNLSLTADRAVLAGWIVSVAIVIGLCWAALTWRSEIMYAWPPSERLFSALGLPAGR